MSLNVHHQRAAAVITVAAALDVALGAAFGTADHIGTGNGLYFATSVATTSGNSPFFPHGWLAYTLAVAMHVTMIPLWLAAFSLLTSGFTGSQVREHVEGSESRIKQHVEDRLASIGHVTEGNELRRQLKRYREALESIALHSEGYDPGTNEHDHYSTAIAALSGRSEPALEHATAELAVIRQAVAPAAPDPGRQP